MVEDHSSMKDLEYDSLVAEIDGHRGLNDVLSWAASKPKSEVHPQLVAEVITQDEFTHDVIVPYRSIFLVYDTT